MLTRIGMRRTCNRVNMILNQVYVCYDDSMCFLAVYLGKKKRFDSIQRVFYYLAPLSGTVDAGAFMLDTEYLKLYGQKLLDVSLDNRYNQGYIIDDVMVASIDLSFLNNDKLNFWIANNVSFGLLNGLLREDDLLLDARNKKKAEQQQKLKQVKQEVGTRVYEDMRHHRFIYLGCYNNLYFYYPITGGWATESMEEVMKTEVNLQITKQPKKLQNYKYSYRFVINDSNGRLKQPLTQEFINEYIRNYAEKYGLHNK